jgi:acetoin utilization deacetylase AcuC-like enzyme
MFVSLISHPDCLLHETGELHPEKPERISAINDQIISAGLEPFLHHYDAPMVTREQLYLAHDKDYVDGLFLRLTDDEPVWLDEDTVMNKASLTAACRSAGAAVLAVDQIMASETTTAFCNVRPPGHHAEYAKAMGFCLFNNIAVAAHHAMQDYGLERIAVVDFDVHHGNGTESIFSNEPRVLFCSSFQHPFYPDETQLDGPSNMVKVPLEAGSTGEQFREAITAHWLPALHAFKPQMLFISAGFDAHQEDEMAGLALVESDYAWVTEQMRDIADKYAEGRIVSALEGGYDSSALPRSVVAHLKALM